MANTTIPILLWILPILTNDLLDIFSNDMYR